MYHRKIIEKFEKTIRSFRSVALTGARQVGKSFFLRNYIAEHGGVYQTMDDPLVRKEALEDPLGWILRHRRPKEPFIIDEAVKCPEIFNAVKVIVDREDPVPTKIVLASSSNYLLVRQIKESLAGRVGLLNLYPLCWSEIHGSGKSRIGMLFDPKATRLSENKFSSIELDRERTSLLLKGGFPEIQVKDDFVFTREWSAQYFSTYLLPLAVELFHVVKQNSFEQVFRQICLRTSQLTNYSDIGKTVDLSSVSVKNHLHYLEAMMVLKSIDQFFPNRIKRLVKSPKIHILDPLFLTSIFGTPQDLSLLKHSSMDGSLYESWIFSEILKTIEYESLGYQISTWHTEDQAEVDIILSAGLCHIPIEIKFKNNISRRDLSSLRSWLSVYDKETPAAYIVYPGSEIKRMDEKIWAIPDHFLFGVSGQG